MRRGVSSSGSNHELAPPPARSQPRFVAVARSDPNWASSRRRCAENGVRHAVSKHSMSWASTFEGSGTTGEYVEWRRTVAPAAPSRNTVVAAFGSWRAALVAAGLSCDRAQLPDRHAKVRATRSSARAAQLVKRRNLVLDAVTACVADLGREPRAGEFLRWRLHEAPESPCQMTLYRALPQGFAEVLVELRARSVRQLRVQLDRLHGRQGLRYRAAFLRRLGVLLEVVVVDSGH